MVSKPCQARVLPANSPTSSSCRKARVTRDGPAARSAGSPARGCCALGCKWGGPVRGHPLSVLKPLLITDHESLIFESPILESKNRKSQPPAASRQPPACCIIFSGGHEQ